MAPVQRYLLVVFATCAPVFAQAEAKPVEDLLKEEILSPSVANFQLRNYILGRVGKLPTPASATEWTTQSKQLREKMLKDVVFHGWPKEWVDAPPKFEDLGVTQGNGYQMRKLRYEIIPGFQSVAILYEPLNMHGKIPAILNTNGHVGAPGKSVEYKQKRCITFARNGIMALNLEWLSYGELTHEWNDHFFGAHMDLVGTNELGLFYLAMRKGLDYLYNHPNTDRSRLGMTGLSGGGWQTIILSSLDERVRVAVPVAGFSSIIPRVEARDYGDIGDVEQSATDLFEGRDYSYLAAMMAPRPTLLTYNAEDDCCFRAAMVKPLVFDAIRPFFALYRNENDFAWHENRDPGTHNYQLNNRLATYEFFSRQFKLPLIKEDTAVAAEVKSYEDLVVGLPSDNLTIVGLARKLADQVKREPLPSDQQGRDAERARLKEVVRYRPTGVASSWTTGISKHMGVQSKAHLFTMEDGLSSNGVWLKAIDAPDSAPVTIVLDDKGRSNGAEEVAERVNRGEQVLAVDLPFTGEAWKQPGTWAYQQMIYTTGTRPLGLEVSHLIALANLMKQRAGTRTVRLESSGIRNGVVALVAAALEPSLFGEVIVRHGMPSLRYLVDKPVKFHEAPDLFCLDLFKVTDLDRLAALAKPTSVKTQTGD
jgi:dienelactone hydrolase